MTQSGFAHAGLTDVLLPSGYRVRGVIPDLYRLAQLGLLDGRVLAAATRLADEAWLDTSTPAEQERDIRAYVDAMIAAAAREALDPGADPATGEWKPTGLTAANLDGLDPRDRALLEDLVLHVRTAAEVSALSEQVIWGIEPTKEAGELDRLAGFRGEPRGAAPGDDGPDVVDQAVDDAGTR